MQINIYFLINKLLFIVFVKSISKKNINYIFIDIYNNVNANKYIFFNK